MRIAAFVRAIERPVAAAELTAIVAALAAMLACVTANVIDRTFALPWPDLSEVALAAMSVLAFIGGAYAVHSKGHIAVDAVDFLPSAAARRVLGVAVDVAIVAFSGLLLLHGGAFLAYVFRLGERTPELQLPLAAPVGCMILGAVLSIMHVVCRWIVAVADVAKPDEPLTPVSTHTHS